MDIQIIHLSTADDTLLLLDWIRHHSGRRVLLVAPGHGSVLTRRLEFVLLSRAAQSVGSRLALVTRQRARKKKAESAGILVFATVKEARLSRWSPAAYGPEETLEKRSHPDLEKMRPSRARESILKGVSRGFAVLGLILALTLMGGLAFPRALVAYQPEQLDQQLTTTITAIPSGKPLLGGQISFSEKVFQTYPSGWRPVEATGQRSESDYLGVSQEDIDKLRADLISQADGALPELLIDALDPGEIPVLSQPSPTRIEILGMRQGYGDHAGQLFMVLVVEFTIPVVREADLLALGNAAMDAKLQNQAQILPGTLTYLLEDAAEMEADQYGLAVQFNRTVVEIFDREMAYHILRGKRPETALVQLSEGMGFPSLPEVTLKPAWLPWLPLMPYQFVFTTPDLEVE